jgi:CBS domain containing-hemolysin-like protein
VSWPVTAAVATGLVAANGFFVAVEFGLLAARQGRLEPWAEQGRFGAATALRQMRDLNVQLAACQLGITVSSLVLGWLLEPPLAHLLEGWLAGRALPPAVGSAVGLGLALTVVALVHMVLGEMVPKSLALTAPERTAATLAPLQAGAVFLMRPAVVVLDRLSRWGTRLLRVEPADEVAEARTPDELAALLEEARRSGELEATEHVLLAGALGFLDRRVRDVMAPRAELVTVPTTASVAEAEELVRRSGHTRVLVVGSGPDDVAGFLHAKDLLRLPPDRRWGLLPPGLVRVALRVRPDDRLSDLLLRMRRARRHVAVVADRDPSGTTRVVGLVTLEDVLEAIIGDIRDESDRGAPR